MARLNWEGSPLNAASIVDMYLVDSLGQIYGFLNALSGDVTITGAKVGTIGPKNRGFVMARLAGEVEDGSISIPLTGRAPTATFGSGQPSLLDILSQNAAGVSYVPFTTVSLPATGIFPARTIYSDKVAKSWQIVIDINTGPIDGAPYTARYTCYPLIPTLDYTLANVGGASTTTIVGKLDDPAAGVWTAV